MANKYAVNQTDLISIADTIREKSGLSEKLLFPSGFKAGVGSVYEAGYEAGHVEGIDVQTIAFEDWHNGTNESSWAVIPHGLGVAPRFVALIADNISAIKNATLPDGIDAALIQTDATFDPDTSEKYNLSYIRWQGGASNTATFSTSIYPNRLIAKVDEQNVYINSAAGSYAWAPSTISTYTLICLA